MCVHAVTPTLVICVMYLTSIWRILLMTDGLNAVWSNDRAAPTDTNPKNLELAPPQSVTATRLDQLVYSPNYYIQIFQTQPFARSEDWTLNLHARSYQVWRAYRLRYGSYIEWCILYFNPYISHELMHTMNIHIILHSYMCVLHNGWGLMLLYSCPRSAAQFYIMSPASLMYKVSRDFCGIYSFMH